MGGQIMPPVMGAVAFIMAETLNISYAEVVKAAIIPAMLYFGACFWQVHLEAGKANLRGMDKKDLPNPWHAVREHWPLVLPLAALVYLLFAGYTPIFAGTMGLALTIVLILGMPLAARIGPLAFRVVFWIALGVAAASFLEYGVDILALVIGALVLACLLFKGGRQTLLICINSLAEGAKNALPVGIACAIVGIVIGTLTLTGIASTLIGSIIAVGKDSLFLSLVLTMLTCLVLGMGIPTIPNYIITSSLAGPALLELGVPLLVSHMFVFYFGIMADLTPPVALAAFAAAPIAKVSGQKIGWAATKLAIAGYVVPFMAVYTPALMLQDAGPIAASFGYPVEVAYVVLKACLGIVLWGAAVVGFLAARLAWWERAVAFAAGVLLVLALPLTDEAGFALALLWIGWHWWRARRAAGLARHEPLHSSRRQDGHAGGRRLHPVLDPFGRADALGGGLDDHAEAGLQIVEARVEGSGAGMEPGEGAVLRDGWWIYKPELPPQREIVLAASGAPARDGGYARLKPAVKSARRPVRRSS